MDLELQILRRDKFILCMSGNLGVHNFPSVFFCKPACGVSTSVNGEMCGSSCQEKCFHILQAERRIIILLLSGVSFLFNLDFFTGVHGNSVSASCKLHITL